MCEREGVLYVGLHFGSKKTVKISIVFDDLSRKSFFEPKWSPIVCIICTVTGINVDDLLCDFPRKIGQDLSQSLYESKKTMKGLLLCWRYSMKGTSNWRGVKTKRTFQNERSTPHIFSIFSYPPPPHTLSIYYYVFLETALHELEEALTPYARAANMAFTHSYTSSRQNAKDKLAWGGVMMMMLLSRIPPSFVWSFCFSASFFLSTLPPRNIAAGTTASILSSPDAASRHIAHEFDVGGGGGVVWGWWLLFFTLLPLSPQYSSSNLLRLVRSDGMQCCRSDWPGLFLFCCHQPSCVVSQQS